MSDRDGFTIPEVGGALRHLTGTPGTPGTPAGSAGSAGSAGPAAPARAGDADAATASRLSAGVRRSARAALADRLAALVAEAAARCRPPVELLPEDVGPELHRLPSDLAAEARRLTVRMDIALPEDVLAPLPDDPKGCRARVERLLVVLGELEGQSVRVTDARLRLSRAGR